MVSFVCDLYATLYLSPLDIVAMTMGLQGEGACTLLKYRLDLKHLLFYRYVPPSQGGRYSGFGNQVDSAPSRSSSVTDFYEGSLTGLTSVSINLNIYFSTNNDCNFVNRA